jgi:hypothetical protein
MPSSVAANEKVCNTRRDAIWFGVMEPAVRNTSGVNGGIAVYFDPGVFDFGVSLFGVGYRPQEIGLATSLTFEGAGLEIIGDKWIDSYNVMLKPRLDDCIFNVKDRAFV